MHVVIKTTPNHPDEVMSRHGRIELAQQAVRVYRRDYNDSEFRITDLDGEREMRSNNKTRQ